MQITLQQLQHIFPATKAAVLTPLVPALNKTFATYDISNKLRVSAFLAQVGHESGGFNFMKENLNYSAEGLRSVFKKYFTPGQAATYARQPVKIANRVYANRMGNGSEASGDGFKFRGRGYIQLTGKENYTLFAKSLGKTIDQTIAYLETIEGACASAGWFWSKHQLNVYADANKFVTITQKINGGQKGAEDRAHLFAKALSVVK